MKKHHTQRGVALFITLIMLVAMTIAALALVRTIDTANVIAGNLAFKQSSLQIGDIGIEAAASALPANILSGTPETVWNISGSTCSSDACRNYYPSMLATNAIDVPTSTINWTTSNSTVGTQIIWDNVPPVVNSNIPTGYTIRYIIDRLCKGPTPVSDIAGKCLADVPVTEGQEKGVSGRPVAVMTSADAVYYRVTVRVTGPRSTETYIQSILTGPPTV
jgi:Tfp pilus assembly protein PilX